MLLKSSPLLLRRWTRPALLSLSAMLLLSACASSPQTSPPVVVAPPSIPPLSPVLSKQPEPSGSYLGIVQQWQQTLQDALRNWQAK